MPPRLCSLCGTAKAIIKRPKTGSQVCKDCFFEVFETEVHNTIIENGGIFKRGDKVAIGASGGKGTLWFHSIWRRHMLTVSQDSTVLAHVMSTLNTRYDYGLDLFLLSIDEGITGYRDDSLEVSLTAVTRGTFLKICPVSPDRQAESNRVRSATQDPELPRALRMDNGQDCQPDRKEE